MSEKRIELRRATFRRWLANHRAGYVVGYRRASCCCPLARFLKMRGGHVPTVHARHYSTAETLSRRLPEWARQFARITDEDGAAFTAVSAAEALSVLDGIP